jgi:hypothetical protein
MLKVGVCTAGKFSKKCKKTHIKNIIIINKNKYTIIIMFIYRDMYSDKISASCTHLYPLPVNIIKYYSNKIIYLKNIYKNIYKNIS